MSHSDHRTIVVTDVGYKPSLVKQPDDIFDYLFDYTAWLGDDTTITSALITIKPVVAGSPTAGTPTIVNVNTGVNVAITGGNDHYRGVVTCLATMANGDKKEAEFELNVKEVDYVATS